MLTANITTTYYILYIIMYYNNFKREILYQLSFLYL